MNKIIVSSKKFVHRNKRTIAVGVTAGAVIYLQARGINGLNNFLKEKNLFDEYYLTDLV